MFRKSEEFVAPDDIVARIIVVGGGGGGQGAGEGDIINCGGGAGSGYVTIAEKSLTGGTSYAVTIGKGGAAN